MKLDQILAFATGAMRRAGSAPASGGDGAEADGFTEAQRAAGAYWDRIAAAPVALRTAWWNDPPTLRHVNRIVCGEPLDHQHAGFHRRLAEILASRSLERPRAISVGSGNGSKEIRLIHDGIVGSFDCFDAGAGAIAAGRALAADQGVSDRVRYIHANALTLDLPADYDLVYWNSALHHMPDTAAAVAWSHARLRPGGVFAADEYVGASRFQHTPSLMAWTNRMLALLPERLLRRPDGNGFVPRALGLIPVEELVKIDPTEAVDSANILPAVRHVFPDAEIIPTGGALYFVALNDAFHNFVTEDDLRLLDALLLADEAIGQLGETQYAVILAVK
jgi:SAM-dependent methyltransferase